MVLFENTIIKLHSGDFVITRYTRNDTITVINLMLMYGNPSGYVRSNDASLTFLDRRQP